MKIIFAIILCFFHVFCFAQAKTQNVLSIWDSLFLHHKYVEDSFNAMLKKDYGRSDTVKNKDSIIIRFTTKEGQLLKKIFYSLDSTGCKNFVQFSYYNKNERISYTKRHDISCPVENSLNSQNRTFNPIYYERFDYDSHGRVIIYIDSRGTRASRTQYIYNSDGTVERIRKKIPHTEFWK